MPITTLLTYDDVLVVPRYSEVIPTHCETTVKLHKNITLTMPILSAAMDTITEFAMAKAIANFGGLGIVHKAMTINQQAKIIQRLKNQQPSRKAAYPAVDKNNKLIVGAATGVSDLETCERFTSLLKAGADAICIDSAHGHSRNIIKYLRKIRKINNEVCLIVGNVATKEAGAALDQAGADVIKVGMGPGSICTTRIISGVGCPQISALQAVASELKKVNSDAKIIADGGIKYSGDITKAIVAGADAVMIGSLLAGTEESPGDEVIIDNTAYKRYLGMGSMASIKQSSDRYNQMNATKFVPEGIESLVKSKGSVIGIFFQLLGGLKAGMGYTGSPNIATLKTAQLVQITPNAHAESHPHSVKFINTAPNYEK